MKKIKKIYIVIFCVFVCLIALAYYYHFIYLAKSPFYALLQEVEDKKLDMEVCYFMSSQKNAKALGDIYSFCKDKKEKNLYHRKIRYEQYKKALKNAKIPKKIPAQKTMLLENDKDTIRFYSGVAIFFSKDSKPIYEIKLGVCPKINGKNYEYNEDFYATLEAIVATQDPARAKRILTYKKSNPSYYHTYHIEGVSCVDSYVAESTKYCSPQRQIQMIEEVYYECLDFWGKSKDECEIKRKKDMDFIYKYHENIQGECIFSLD